MCGGGDKIETGGFAGVATWRAGGCGAAARSRPPTQVQTWWLKCSVSHGLMLKNNQQLQPCHVLFPDDTTP